MPYNKQTFSEILSKCKFDNKVYGQILCDLEDDIGYCTVSLSNDAMMKFDLEYFSKINNLDDNSDFKNESIIYEYHPYFYELFSVIAPKDKHNKEIIDGLNGKWFNMELEINYKKEFKHDKGVCIYGDIIKIYGTLIFGASPIERYRATLKFSKNNECQNNECNLKKEIVSFIRNHNNTNKVKEELENKLTEVTNVSGSVYNVGQGNCIFLEIDNKETKTQMFFDVGESISPNKEEQMCIETNRREFQKQTPDFIILSHWDIDHILGVCNFKNDNEYSVYRECKWIAPDLQLLTENDRSLSACRLCAFLLHRKLLWLINKENTDEAVLKSCDNRFVLWQGMKVAGQGNKKNNIGLIIQMKILSNDEILFCGDCEYDKMPNKLLSESYTLVVTAHHGSKRAMPNKLRERKYAKAIISAGSNVYGHPDIEHIGELNSRFRLFFTAGCLKIKFKGRELNAIRNQNYKEISGTAVAKNECMPNKTQLCKYDQQQKEYCKPCNDDISAELEMLISNVAQEMFAMGGDDKEIMQAPELLKEKLQELKDRMNY